MNILQVIPYFTFTRGGDVNVCYNLTKELIKEGHEVTILTSTFEYNKEDTDNITNLTMVPIKYKFNLSLFIYTPLMKKWLKENIKKYDIIHLHELRSYQNNIIIKYAKKYNIPYILQPHASTPKHITKGVIKKIYDIYYGNKIMQNATSVIAVSEEEAYYDKIMKAKKIHVVYNGMNINTFNTLPPLNTFKDKFNINAPYILYLGRLDSLKGIDCLIKSFSKLPKEFNEYKLVIAGKINPYKLELDKIIKRENLEKKVIFTDFVKEEYKLSIYHDADLFISTVKYMGGVSLTVFEAILSNTPIIVTKEAGELVEKINCGTIVTYGNIQELTDNIIISLTKKSLTQKQLENGQKYITTNLTWPIVTKKIITIYESAINKN